MVSILIKSILNIKSNTEEALIAETPTGVYYNNVRFKNTTMEELRILYTIAGMLIGIIYSEILKK